MMEEDGAVKAPMTRLRRRLSIEQSEDTNSPGPSTPTKKRTGRLATKPQLELIDENTPNGTSKSTNRKTAVKDVTEALAEKPLTPGRRSARIKSNTSIISGDTTHGYESPRAKRATRRKSCTGCNTSTCVTPTKQTLQTKKESPPKLETTLASKPNNITKIIIEESESNNGNRTEENVSLRKSPRLRGRQKKEANVSKESNPNNSHANNDENNTTVNGLNSENEENLHAEKRKYSLDDDKTASEPEKVNNNLSDTSLDVIKNFDSKPKNKLTKGNKSMSSLENNNNICLSKKQRTNSLTLLSKIQKNDDGFFFSDSEILKKNLRKNRKPEKLIIDNSTSEDGRITSNNLLNKSTNKENDTVLHASNSSENFLVANNYLSEYVPGFKTYSNEANNVNNAADDNISMSSILEKDPNIVQSSVFFEDSSDTESKKKSPQILLNPSDKCVPVVVTVECESMDNMNNFNDNDKDIQKSSILNKEDDNSIDDGCEPMDIDETIPNNITDCGSPKSQKSLLDNAENVREPAFQNNSILIESSNKSKHKSSISPSTSQNIEKTRNESKSTLIISQIKDVLSADNSVCKSPNNKATEILSKCTNYEESNEKENDKKNISLDYSTSTPLQQKKLKKIGMQINTSIINSSNNEHKNPNDVSHISKKDMSRISRSSESYLSDEESQEKTPNTKSKLLDDEADEASDDYESGDSRDESERINEKNNEIVEKGETLDSEEEMSEDTDYEKDSFVVSSNEEDDELLSGSGDDLSMSDNELTMSKKSKIKYNERKIKDQKKASKEMFEARHKLSESKNKRMKNKQKIDSSSSSEDDVIAPVKKNKNLRLDSTHEESFNKSDSSSSKPSKKRVSVQSEGTNKEEEMCTVFDRSLTQIDPLSAQIKVEPQTPMKSLNISTVQIFDNIEEVEVDNNVSFEKTNLTQDTLQDSLAKEDGNSSISECSEIMNNYDSVLNELNKKEKTKVKVCDTSLNLNKKNKKHCQEPIVDQLNLTGTKTSKKKKNLISNNSTPSFDEPKDKSQNRIPVSISKDASSDSIDLQILFSEDSSELGVKNNINLTKTADNATDNFIPLKRTPGKINILNKGDAPTPNDENSIQFIIDTQGTRKRDNECFNGVNTTETGADENANTPMEISYKSSKKSRKSTNTDQVNTENKILSLGATESSVGSTKKNLEASVVELSSKKNKKKLSESQIETTDHSNTPVHSLDGTKKKKKLSESQTETAVETSFNILNCGKKKNKSLSESQLISVENTETPAQPIDSMKKKKKLIDSQIKATDASNTPVQPPDSKKKNKKLSESQLDATDASETQVQSLDSTQKKKKLSESQIEVTDASNTTAQSLSSKKKKKKLSESQIDATDASKTPVQPLDSKKKKKKLSESQDSLESRDADTSFQILNSGKKKNQTISESQVLSVDTIATSFQSLSSKKKKKKSLTESQSELIVEGSTSNISTEIIKEDQQVDDDDTSASKMTQTKKRKRKEDRESSFKNTDENFDHSSILDQSETSITNGRQKKKRKLSQNKGDKTTKDNNQDIEIISNITNNIGDEPLSQLSSQTDQRHKNKKRKRDDDDNVHGSLKVMKQSSFENVHVTRLPASLLSQLDDKPAKEFIEKKKSLVVSTTPFVVEETRKRRNKPSNFLEESVYLNDSNNEKKRKSNIKKPKVLPFVPTAATSGNGFTTNFKIKTISQNVEFVAQMTNENNFKNDYLYGKRIKRLGTYEMYKKQRSAKMSKF